MRKKRRLLGRSISRNFKKLLKVFWNGKIMLQFTTKV